MYKEEMEMWDKKAAVPVPEGLWDPYEQELVLTTVVAENSGTSFQNGDTYASDTLKSYYEAERDTYETGCLGGRLYGIPQLSYGNIDKFDYVWIRKDWKEELGLEDPKTMDDVIAIAEAFKENFGGYAMGEMQTLDNLNRLAVAFGAHPGIWVEMEDGTLEYGTVQPEMKEVIEAYAKWYAQGIICPEFTTTNQDKMFQDAINGDVGVIPFAQWFGYNPGPQIIENLGPEAIFELYPIPSANEGAGP